jgi:hypothetical protein
MMLLRTPADDHHADNIVAVKRNSKIQKEIDEPISF